MKEERYTTETMQMWKIAQLRNQTQALSALYVIFVINICSTYSSQVKFTIDEDVDGPIYVYYELQNFYQNHRRYVKSRSAYQLEGQVRQVMMRFW